MPIWDYVIVCIAAFLGGAVNSIAGGGTLIVFPALGGVLGNLSHHLKIANATTTVALAPGSLASAWAYRHELYPYRRWLYILLAPSLIGGVVGSGLLLLGKDETFGNLVPWLILLATLLFALQPKISSWIRMEVATTTNVVSVGSFGEVHQVVSRTKLISVLVFQFFVGIYGGYFGAGIGILMLSALAMMGLNDIHGMNAVKTILATVINAAAIILFLYKQYLSPEPQTIINWELGIPMLVAGIAGGYFGAIAATKMNKNLVRSAITVIGFTLATWYFYNTYWAA